MANYIYRNYTVEYLFDKRYVCSGYGDVTKPSGDFENYIIFYQLNPSSTPEEQKMEIESIKSKISYILNSEIRERIIIFSLFRDVNKDWEMKSPELLEAIDDFNLHFLKQHSEQYKNVKIVDINTFINLIAFHLLIGAFSLQPKWLLIRNWISLSKMV